MTKTQNYEKNRMAKKEGPAKFLKFDGVHLKSCQSDKIRPGPREAFKNYLVDFFPLRGYLPLPSCDCQY